MKLNYFIKALPFLSTLLLIIFLNISNQKENTKLRILIWDTPSYSLGTYLALSTGSGFIISYILTTNIANICKVKSNQSLDYKIENDYGDNKEYNDINFRKPKEKTLIERDISEPSPTINAQFRVIAKAERYNTNYVNNNIQYDESCDFDQPVVDQNETNHQKTDISSDWNDDSFNSW